MAQVSKDSKFDVSQEFIESGKLLQSKSKKRGGPYSKDEKIKRQNEVHRLHFEYGYSARKISELMKINRNTINGDIDCWYGKIINTQIKLADSTKRIHRLGIGYLNDWLKENGKDTRYLNYFDRISVSKKAQQRISKIIKEDKIKTGI